jgi:hypothetical protein
MGAEFLFEPSPIALSMSVIKKNRDKQTADNVCRLCKSELFILFFIKEVPGKGLSFKI